MCDERKLYDFDRAFDERIGEYMQKKKGKFTQEQWEDALPRLYRQFSAAKIEAIGCSPTEYYARMTPREIERAVTARLENGINIDGFLRAALEKEDNKAVLLRLLQGEESAAAFAAGILREDEEAYPYYLALLERGVSERLQGELAELLYPRADEYAGQLLELYRNGKAEECAANVLSRVAIPREEIFAALVQSFLSGENPGEGAERLARYGDERALPYILDRLQEPLSYPDWRNMKYAAESLGGKVADRDFSRDKDYLRLKEEEERLKAEQRGEQTDRA